MLNLLVKYAQGHEVTAEPGFLDKRVDFILSFASDGRFLGALDRRDHSGPRPRAPRIRYCPHFEQPELVGGGGRSNFLVESLQVVALYEVSQDDVRIRRRHAFFVRLLREASGALPQLAILASALASESTLARISADLRSHKARSTASATLAVNDQLLVESEAWHDWWRQFRQEATQGSIADRTMRCLISGLAVKPVRTVPKVKGLVTVGGAAMGDAPLCFDKDAFCSYDLPQSANAAVSEGSAWAIRAALERLLDDHSHSLADAKIVHWFDRNVPAEDNPLEWLRGSEEQQELNAQARAAKLLQSIRTGERADLADNHYYALTLSGMSGRIMVRDWMEGKFEDLVRNVNGWFDDLQIVRRDGPGMATPPKFMAVLGSLVRDLDELPPPFVVRMWRVAANRETIPRQALAMAVARARADVIGGRSPNHARMGLMKAYHLRKKGESHLMPYLNEDHPDPAYHCGRLMAVYAAIQHAAMPNVDVGVVQRYYAAASATPGLILGRLSRLSQFHLGKLQHDSPGLARCFGSKLAGIWARIADRPPTTLTLEEQSLFALGYYQQMAADRKGKPKVDDQNTESKED